VNEDLVRILDGNTFLVSDERGDVRASSSVPTGLFSYDTRFLSTWVLTVNGQQLQSLAVDDLQYFEARFFLAPGSMDMYPNSGLSVIRHRWIRSAMQEQLTIINYDRKPARLRIRIEAGCDFADLFEVKGAIAKQGASHARLEDGALILGYHRGHFRRETVIRPEAGARLDEGGIDYDVELGPQETWSTGVNVQPLVLTRPGHDVRSTLKGHDQPRQQVGQDLDEWLARAPRLRTDRRQLEATYRRSLVDLAALRFAPLTEPDRGLPAAGLPWFMSIFGRDSILTSLQALPFVPELASATLGLLGTLQGSRLDDFREEEPGKILHEFRYGESAAFEEQPQSPYFGSADATPLFVVLMDEYHRWTGDDRLIRRLEHRARAALRWIDDYADLMGNWYVSYQRRNDETGLVNQCWKDSWDSISYRDGRLPGPARATCELQGYAYDAKRRAARLARELWDDPGFAERLEREAADLKRRFNRDFWVPEDGRGGGGYFALALEADGSQVDALSSNIGHLLWSGIVDTSRAASVVSHLMGPRLYSGWGVRTLATGEGRYNPVGYHVGTVWPFDNSFIAWGLRRYGFKEEAARIAQGILQSAEFFEGRLPEAFAGYDRELTRYPVQYPTACSPQAWSTGAPLLLLRTMLGLEPLGDHLTVDPALPPDIGWLGLLDIPGRWGRFDAFGRGHGAPSVPVISRFTR
jgi:glycogen debranching enzyme